MNVFKLVTPLILSFVVGSAFAEIIKVPAKRPVITVDIPDSWDPEETDRGVACESPDKTATLFFEIARSEKAVGAIIDESIAWLTKEQGVKIKGETKHESEMEVGGIKSSLTGYDAMSKEFGAAKVGFVMTPIDDKLLIITYWFSLKGFAMVEPVIDKMMSSVKPVK